ncbi:hypothetical protein V8D89_014575 [Ganoderma adspersum]
MQVQAAKQDQHQAAITSQQSLQSIQTLLRAGLGCITYLRLYARILHDAAAHTPGYLTSGSDTLSSQPSKSDSMDTSFQRKNVSGFKIMTITRGFTEEADKLLNYMVTSFLLYIWYGLHLHCGVARLNAYISGRPRPEQYYKVPGSNETVPVMTLGEEMDRLSLSSSTLAQDPVAKATKMGKTPTLGEVKRSLKALIKNLIQATTQMDALPKRRFATFKLFYYENTPDNYEPPHFRAGDADKDKWFMATHRKDEAPERCSVGFVHTGYHGVDVNITSVSAYLPSGEDNNAPFLGTTTKTAFTAPSLTPVEEAAMRAQQIEVQRQDAAARIVVWDGDGGMGHVGIDCRTEGHVDTTDLVPVGVRSGGGSVVPYSLGLTAKEAQYSGRPETIPMCIGQLAMAKPQLGQEVSPTQEIEDSQLDKSTVTALCSSLRSPTPTQRPRDSSYRHGHEDGSPLPPSDIPPSVSSSTREPETIDTQCLKDIIMANASVPEDDSVMLDMETQQVPGVSAGNEPDEQFAVAHDLVADTPMDQDAEHDEIPECECGVQATDCDLCYCDGGCERWFHLWCMGYHSARDNRVPDKFICFDCRVRADRNWDLIVVHDLYPRMIARFKDLAIQRRGIKLFETHAPDGLSAFMKLIGCDSTVAGQVFKRLEAEGFIAQESRELDESGMLATTTVTSKRRGRGRGGKTNPKPRTGLRRKNLQKAVYVFVQNIKNEDVYKDYFNPDPEVEKRLLGLSDLKPERKNRRKRNDAGNRGIEANGPSTLRQEDALQGGDPELESAGVLPAPAALESQTQEETQVLPTAARHCESKRKMSGGTCEESAKKTKKIKISLGPPVDLGD